MNSKVVSIALAVLLAGLVALPGCVPQAELDECRALVVEQSATIEEKTAQIEALEAEIVELENERTEVPEEEVMETVKYGKIDGNIDDWPSDIAMISDPAEDLTGDVKDERGVDLKAVWAFMNEDYLYVAIEIYDVFDLSLLRNYFIAVDCDKDYWDEYHFGVRPSGRTWVFDHTVNPNNWVVEWVLDVAAHGETNVIEVEIPRKAYEIPSSIFILCRVTEGGPNVDSTEWFEVSLDEGT